MTLYLGNNTNLLREAILAATNIAASSSIFRTDTAPKQGRGIVSVTGPFTGSSDETIDVEILGTDGTTARVSLPIFEGVGNGTMTDVTADVSLPAETVVVSLQDFGSQTADAIAQFQGQQLDAIETGDDGNLVTITVDRTNITRAASNYSIPAGGISEGTNEYSGDQWNFGAVTLTADGKFPVDGAGALTAPRISFGDDPQVYRPFRKFVGSGYVYGFSPAPVRDVAAGAKVWIVSGAYQLLITDGITPETLTDITTLYSALVNIRDNSDLVKPNDDPALGPVVTVVNDLTPGGKGVVDVDVFTNAYITQIDRDGSQQILDAQFPITATDDAPTELLTLTATSGSRFRVEGSVSGRLTDATAGEPYTDGPYAFTIPEAIADPGDDPDASIAVTYVATPDHNQDANLPKVTFHDPRLGPAARAGTYTFTWRNRPPPPCDGSDAVYSGGIDFACLGLTGEGGGAIVAEHAEITVRQQKLLTALRGYVDGNTTPPSEVDEGDVGWLMRTFGIFVDALTKLDGEGATLDADFPDFQTSHAYTKGTIIIPPSNGNRMIVVQAGTSAGTAPTWPAVGDAVTSNTVVFVNLGPGPIALFDDAFDDLEDDADLISGQENTQSIPTWSPGMSVSDNTRVVPIVQNGFFYLATAIADADGATVHTGTTSSNEPKWPSSSTVLEYSDTSRITWTATAFTDLSVEAGVRDSYFQRYVSRMNEVLFAAGLDANFDSASVEGDGCWQDQHGTAWWESQDGYLPFQNGIYNTTSTQTLDANGHPVNNATHEFGFGIEVGCEDKLREGDQLVVVIQGGFSESGGGYQPGDNVQATVIHGERIALTGGQTGTDAMTWSVTAGGVALTPYLVPFTGPPTPYSDGDIGFTITPGSIDFVLGDQFTFDIENGQFRYRINGGSFTSAADIADTSIGNGLTITFTGGAAPSWVDGDAWSFTAQAINGPDALRQPTEPRCKWTAATVITITPGGDNDDVSGILIGDHDIPSSATITVKGGTVGFSVATVTVAVPWRKGSIWQAIDPLTCAEWRVEVSAAGAANWIHLGTGTTPFMVNGLPEQGIATKLRQLAGFLKRSAIGARIEHTALAQDSVDEIFDMLEHACENDDCRFGLVLNLASSEGGIVSIDPNALQQLGDELGFQPLDIDASLQSLTIDLIPVA